MTRPLTLIQTTGAADCLTEPNGNRRFAALPCRVTVPGHPTLFGHYPSTTAAALAAMALYPAARSISVRAAR